LNRGIRNYELKDKESPLRIRTQSLKKKRFTKRYEIQNIIPGSQRAKVPPWGDLGGDKQSPFAEA
jgi:hypothetical protein